MQRKRETCRLVDGHAEADRQARGQTDIHPDIHEERYTDNQTNKQGQRGTERHTDTLADRDKRQTQKGTKTERHSCIGR